MLVRLGQCSHCGKCCLPPVMVENPMINRGEDRCKFYVDQSNNQMYGHCLIYARGSRPISVIRDRFHKKITQAQIRWFNDNCIDYPSAEDIEAGYRLPPECSFSFEVVTDA